MNTSLHCSYHFQSSRKQGASGALKFKFVKLTEKLNLLWPKVLSLVLMILHSPASSQH